MLFNHVIKMKIYGNMIILSSNAIVGEGVVKLGETISKLQNLTNLDLNLG